MSVHAGSNCRGMGGSFACIAPAAAKGGAGASISGEISFFSLPFTPQGWMKCNGTFAAQASTWRFSALLGTHVGGDGRALPLPNLPAPPGTSYFISLYGIFPNRSE